MGSLIVLITGGKNGVGNAIAKSCLERGATVFITSRDCNTFPKVVASNSLNLLPLDVRNEQSVNETFEFLQQKVGTIDVLVNNAGLGIFKPLIELSAKDFRETLETNLVGSFLCSKAAFGMMQKKGGRIVNVGSIVDRHAADGNAAYASSKWGLRGLSAAITQEGRQNAVTATHISLGAVYTEIWHGREGFSADDMLAPELVGEQISHIIFTKPDVRIDCLELYPKKGLL